MRRRNRVGLAVVLAVLAVTSVAAEVERVFPYDYRTETLDNGLKVILVPMSSEGLVAYWSVVRTGSRDEYEPGRSGFAHFFEHMMFRGTENYPADVYNQMITRMGADTNAYTTDDLTAYHLGFAAEDLEMVIRLESDRFQNLAFAESVFRTEAGAVYGEYRKNLMNPFSRLYESLQQTAFGEHTYGHTTMGYERDIKQMPEMFDYSRSFFSRYYRPENVVLFIAGDIDPDATLGMVREHYAAWERGYTPPKIKTEPAQTEPRSVKVPYPGQSLPIIWIAYKIDRFDPTDRAYMSSWVLADLAFGSTSEIYKKLVLEEQVVEFIQSRARRNRDPGLFDIYTRVKDPAKVEYVLEQIEAVIERYRENPPDSRRLADLKSRMRYDFLMSLDTPDRVASEMARIVALTGGLEAVDEGFATLEQITPEDVQAAANTYLLPERRTVATLEGGK